MNPTICAHFFTFVHELLDSPLYLNYCINVLYALTASFQAENIPLTDQQLDDIVSRLDTDGDGEVDLGYAYFLYSYCVTFVKSLE